MDALIGRVHELELLDQSIARARGGSGGVLFLSGEPGIGKTRLADEASARARASGMITAWGRAWEEGGAPPFWPWIQIARALRKRGIEPPPELARLLPELGAATAPLLAPTADRFALFDAVLRFLAGAAAREPIVLVLEDLHAADSGTIRLLAFLAPELREIPLLVIGTYRDVEARLTPGIADTLSQIGRAGQALRLGRLGPTAVAELVQANAELGERDLEALYTTTEGNPLFVTECLRALAQSGRRPDGSLPLSDGVRGAIRAHLARLPAELRRHLDVAAVVGREFSASVLAAILDLPVSVVVSELGAAASAGVLVEQMPSRFAFAHGLFREVLHEDLCRREDMHRRVAETLEHAKGGDPTALAEITLHWLAAGPEWAERALASARCAAEAASLALAYEEAAAFYDRALAAHEQALPADARGRAGLMLEGADAWIRAGQVKRSKELCERAAAIARQLGDDELLVQAALGHGKDIVAGATDRELASLLREALVVIGDKDIGLRARVLARLAAAEQPARDPLGPVELAREAIALVEGRDPETRLAVLHNAMGAMIDFVDPRERRPINEELARLAEARGLTTVLLRARLRLFHDHAECGDLAGAALRIEAYEAVASAYVQPHVRFPALLARSGLALLRGRTDESAPLFEQARAIAKRTQDAWLQRAASMHELAALRISGSTSELAERRADFATMLNIWPTYAALDGMIAARQRDPEGARRCLAALDRGHLRVCMDSMVLMWVAEAAAVACDPAWGTIVEEALAPMEGEWASWSGVAYVVDSPVTRGRALAAIARGDRAAAGAHFSRAFAEAEHAGATPIALRIRNEQKDLLEASPAPARASSPAAPVLAFVREEDYWTITGEGATIRLKDSRGMQMLAELVAAVGSELHALDLASAAEAGVAIDAGDAGEVLDARAQAAYRKRIAELTAARAEAEERNDPLHAERARAELDALGSELSRAVGLGGRVRRAGRAAERARVNVQRRISEALRRIGEAHGPIGEHLQKSIRTGIFCSYLPERARR
jgi:hypothetical protein